ncbi:germination protein YpeB [Ammoniphilus oxalaticus]|uniref:Germination protein YpeB n=1 Tax=Ammoniphilus oxalaticus TaxID=66863 RepID=A0A419SN88_9BACL|nr:germination protein YpeB [Ammoniphilus oxalaticus]RKD25681.1 germination protein YpeB [Ammoniphilus oxalaticus]
MVYGKIARVLTPILAVATIGLGVWGYQENQDKNRVLIKAENQYQRAFHDLAFHMDQLQDELGKTMAINSRRQIDGTLSNVWRISSLARSDVGQLPLSLLPFSKTEQFLADIGDFSYRAAIRDLDKEPLNEKEIQKLQMYHQQASKIQGELRNVQDKVLGQQLRWMDVELSLASAQDSGNLGDNTIVEGFKTIDKTADKVVDEYADLDFGPSVNMLQLEKQKDDKNIKGKPINEQQARQVAMKFTGINERDADIKVEKTGKGNTYQAYSVTIKPRGKEEHEINLDITKKGGHVVWLLDNRDVKNPQLDLPQAQQRADEFLKAHQFENMEAMTQEQYGNLAVITYVHTEDGARIYPELMTLQVALDTGNVVGFQAEDYVFNHKQDRKLSKPALTKEQARKEVNPNLHVQESRLAVVLNDRNQETLCYEYVGWLGEEAYRVFIDAKSGEEVTVEKLDGIRPDQA